MLCRNWPRVELQPGPNVSHFPVRSEISCPRPRYPLLHSTEKPYIFRRMATYESPCHVCTFPKENSSFHIRAKPIRVQVRRGGEVSSLTQARAPSGIPHKFRTTVGDYPQWDLIPNCCC